MRKAALGTVILLTAIITALVTSAFWFIAFNAGPAGSPNEPKAATLATEAPGPVQEPEPIVGPAGLAIPVSGVEIEELVDTYDQSRSAGERVHNAIDIMAPEGRAVIAAFDGVVEKLHFSEGGGGITVYVRSPDQQYIFYYAHLRDYSPGLEEGQRVARGDRLGSVGSTGNASQAGPHLHFAVQKMRPDEPWHGGTPVNPYPLLAGPEAAR